MVEIRHLNPEGDWAEGVARLYRLEGWLGEDSPTGQIREAIKNSHCAYGAFDGQKMVGFFRAISDKVSDSYLIDLKSARSWKAMCLSGSKAPYCFRSHYSEAAGMKIFPQPLSSGFAAHLKIGLRYRPRAILFAA